MSNKNQISNLPIPSVGGLSIYLAQIKKFPMLDAEEEYMLAKNWKENGNIKAAHKLVTSHLRFSLHYLIILFYHHTLVFEK